MQRKGARVVGQVGRNEGPPRCDAALIGLDLLFRFSSPGERHKRGGSESGICSLRSLVLFISMSAGQARRVGCRHARPAGERCPVRDTANGVE